MGLRSFNFEIVSFPDGGAVVKLRYGKLIVEGRGLCYVEPAEFKPTKEAWDKFIETVDGLNVWSWKKDYSDPYTLDGTQWSLSMSKAGSKVKCEGSNMYPPDFEKFVRAVNRLAGTSFWE